MLVVILIALMVVLSHADFLCNCTQPAIVTCSDCKDSQGRAFCYHPDIVFLHQGFSCQDLDPFGSPPQTHNLTFGYIQAQDHGRLFFQPKGMGQNTLLVKVLPINATEAGVWYSPYSKLIGLPTYPYGSIDVPSNVINGIGMVQIGADEKQFVVASYNIAHPMQSIDARFLFDVKRHLTFTNNPDTCFAIEVDPEGFRIISDDCYKLDRGDILEFVSA